MTGYLMNWLTDNLPFVAIALATASLIVFLLVILMMLKLKNLTRVHKSLMTGVEGLNLEELLEKYLLKVQVAEKKVSELNSTCNRLDDYAQRSLQNTALLRFNAFENMGSDLSFSAAFLDLQGDGVVLSSINSREESRVYAKPVKNGQSTYHLSKEEMEVIKNALEKTKISS